MRRRSKIVLLLMSFLLFFVLSFISLLFLITTFPSSSSLPSEGIIVVFGAGIYSSRPSLTLQMRLDKGIELYHLLKKKAFFYLAGTKPEVVIMRQYLMKQNISPLAIIEDPGGITTAHTIRNLATSYRSSNLLLVSQQYHLRRIAFLSRKYHLLHTYYVTTERKDVSHQYLLVLREVFALYKAFLWD